ncbi:MAG: sterol desaturase family protein [Pyrinomonadaceae bacterium]
MEITTSLREYLALVGSVVLLTLIFYPFELLAPAERKQPFSKRLINLLYVPIFLALVVLVLNPMANVIASMMFSVTGGGILPYWLVSPSSLAHHVVFALGFAVWWDLWQYWLHRLQHAVPELWETHKFHHSETALNSTTQTRHHIFHHALATAFYFPVLLIIGGAAPHYTVLFVMFRVWGFVNHANLRIHFGVLTPLLSGPQWHRIHHSTVEEHRDRNFATFFPFIDMIFGTYYRPRKGEFPPTGLMNEEKSRPLAEATFEPFVAWARRGQRTIRKLRPTRV